jgi:short-subunit dehydrogenase
MSTIIWIIGANSPSGELLAQNYSTSGHKIILSAENRDELYAVKAKCKGNPMNIHIVQVNKNKPEEMLDRTKEALRIFGRIDTLILCSKTELNKPDTETPIEEAKKIMDINFWANVALTRAVLPIMRRQNSGHILVFNPIEGKIGMPNQSAFSASRHALYGYFDSLRAEQTLPIHITMVLGELRTTKNSVAKFLKKIEKFPEEITINNQYSKLLRLKFLRPKAFFKKLKIG